MFFPLFLIPRSLSPWYCYSTSIVYPFSNFFTLPFFLAALHVGPPAPALAPCLFVYRPIVYFSWR